MMPFMPGTMIGRFYLSLLIYSLLSIVYALRLWPLRSPVTCSILFGVAAANENKKAMAPDGAIAALNLKTQFNAD